MTEDNCMEVEPELKNSPTPNLDLQLDEIIKYLISNKETIFKSQERGVADLSDTEKYEISLTLFNKSKANFLSRFGKNLLESHLEYFRKFTTDPTEAYEISFYLTYLKRYFTTQKRKTDIKNRRFDALKKLQESGNYFSETEMMKRNPLLYDQLVGQYLSEDEKKKRDNIDTKNITFVNLLLESIDRETIRKKQKEQQDDEDCVEEENDSDAEDHVKPMKIDDSSDEDIPPTTSKWGEFTEADKNPEPPKRFDFIPNLFQDAAAIAKENIVLITATERKLLKEEFFSIMYQNFLDGKDTEFDYSTVDNNDEYDNLEIKTHDAEEIYFDSESPENITPEDSKMADHDETSEDELDVFMNRLNKHPTIQELTNDVSKL